MSKLNVTQMTTLAKQFRATSTDAIGKAKILIGVPSSQQAEFLAMVESLAHNAGVQPYTNKAGEVTGVVVHANGTGKRGLYVPNDALSNLDGIFNELKTYVAALKK